MHKGLKNVALLPIKLFRKDERGVKVVDDKISRLAKLSHGHFLIRDCMKELAEVAYPGSPAQLRDGKMLYMRFAIGNYCADLPEQKDLSCVKCNNTTKQPCTRCHIYRFDMGMYKTSKNRTLKEKLMLLET